MRPALLGPSFDGKIVILTQHENLWAEHQRISEISDIKGAL